MMNKAHVTLAMALLLAGCATDPGVIGDRAAPKYRADLTACRASASHAVYLEDAKTFPRWLISPFTQPSQMHGAVHACMLGKGYAAARPPAACPGHRGGS